MKKFLHALKATIIRTTNDDTARWEAAKAGMAAALADGEKLIAEYAEAIERGKKSIAKHKQA